MAVKTLKIIFRKIFLNINQSETYYRELKVSLSDDSTLIPPTATKLNWVDGFIF